MLLVPLPYDYVKLLGPGARVRTPAGTRGDARVRRAERPSGLR